MLSGHVTPAAPGTKAPPALPMHDRLFIIAGIAGIVAVSWAYLVIEAGRMGGGDMMAMVELRPRDATGLVLLFLMWAVMMVAMMLPSAMPMILLQAAVMRKIKTGQSFSPAVERGNHQKPGCCIRHRGSGPGATGPRRNRLDLSIAR